MSPPFERVVASVGVVASVSVKSFNKDPPTLKHVSNYIPWQYKRFKITLSSYFQTFLTFCRTKETFSNSLTGMQY